MRAFYGLDWIVTFAGRTQQDKQFRADAVLGLPALIQEQVSQVAEHAVDRLGDVDHKHFSNEESQ